LAFGHDVRDAALTSHKSLFNSMFIDTGRFPIATLGEGALMVLRHIRVPS